MAKPLKNRSITDPNLLGKLQRRLAAYKKRHDLTVEQFAVYLDDMSAGTLTTYLSARRMKRMSRDTYNFLIEKTARNGTKAKESSAVESSPV